MAQGPAIDGGMLRGALDREVALTPVLVRDVAALSAWYRASPAERGPTPRVTDAPSAYAAYRMPATFAAAGAAMAAAREAAPAFAPASLLDVGSGTGATIWAAAGTWTSIRSITGLDRNASAMELGGRLAHASGSPALQAVRWITGDVTAPSREPAELVTAGYVLGELDDRARARVVDRLWQATTGLLVVIEPGTPAGARAVDAAARALGAGGARILAPCVGGGCALPPPGWCHFSVRLERSRLHRAAKGTALGFEDERFAYLVAGRPEIPATPPAARVIAPPKQTKAFIDLRVCTADGVETLRIARRDAERYRLARRLDWGSPVPPELR